MTCVSRSGAGRTNAIQRESGDHATSRMSSHSSLTAIRRSLPPGRSNSHNSWSLFVCAIHLPSGEGTPSKRNTLPSCESWAGPAPPFAGALPPPPPAPRPREPDERFAVGEEARLPPAHAGLPRRGDEAAVLARRHEHLAARRERHAV